VFLIPKEGSSAAHGDNKTMSRKECVAIDLSSVLSTEELHALLLDALGFPGWYGRNWHAFWDAITGLVEMPQRLNLVGWDSFRQRFPRDAEVMRQCLVEMAEKYPQLSSIVEYS
jgi:RNAse (barnase) inhibitor barstar